MQGELWFLGWVFWGVLQVVGVLIAGVEFKLIQWRAMDETVRWPPAMLVQAHWQVAAARGRLEMMVMVALCWAVVSAAAWLCVGRVR